MRIQLVDNSGVWTDILRKRGAGYVIRTHFLPSRSLIRAFAQELVYSVRGTRKHNFVFSRSQGKVAWTRFSAGTYPFGIAKRISPDGIPYPGLASSTLKHRKYKGVKRGPGFEMRETSAHIFEGIKIIQTNVGNTRAEAEVGWTGFNETLVRMFTTGFHPVDTHWFGQDPPDDFWEIFVEPRPVKGIQPEYQNVIYQAMQNFLKF